MDSSYFLSTSSADGRALLAAAQTGWNRQIPHCPEWDAEGLVGHTGGIFQWMAAIVASGERVSRRDLDPAPDDPTELSSWYLAALGRAIDVLGSTDPATETWTFSSTGDRRVEWWCRRLAVEVAIHRYDAEHAVSLDGDGKPIAGVVAAAGVEEFVVEFLPGLLAANGFGPQSGTLHLHATDGPLDWWVDLSNPSSARPEPAPADTSIGATRSDLLLWLTNRAQPGSLDVAGNHEITDRWSQFKR
jgi:uncharacterized protein (TIGR03083 family)